MFEITLFPSKCTSISNKYPDAASVYYDYLLTGTDVQGDNHRSLFEFDLDGLSKNVLISSAKLLLYSDANESCNQAAFIPYLLNSDWKKETVSWNKQPKIDLSVSGCPLEMSDNSRYEWDITDIVRNWIKHKKHNYGLMLKSSEDGRVDINRIPARWSDDKKPCIQIVFDCYKKIKLASRQVCCSEKEYKAKNVIQYTDWYKVSKYSMYTFFVQNLGPGAIIVQVQISPNKAATFNEKAIYRITKNFSAAIIPMQYAFYNRLLFKTVAAGKVSTMKVWLQAQV